MGADCPGDAPIRIDSRVSTAVPRVVVSEDHRAFVRSLLPEEKHLLVIRDELYEGSWAEMKDDLENRRDGKPFIFKLANRIDEDLQRIDQLSAYEERHQLNLARYLEEE